MMPELNTEELEVKPGEVWDCCGMRVRTIMRESISYESDEKFRLKELLSRLKGGILGGHWIVEVISMNLAEDHPYYGRNDIEYIKPGAIAAWGIGRCGSAWRKVNDSDQA